MKEATICIEGVTPYSQSQYITEPRKNGEGHDDYEKRTWRLRLHVDHDGYVVVPGMGIKKALSYVARFKGEKIKGKGQATWTKHFDAGVMVLENPRLLDGADKPIRAEDVEGEWHFVDANGKPGGTRVLRCFPMIQPPWRVRTTVYVLDDTITEEVFERYLVEAGKFAGIGRFRPENRGFNGRWGVLEVAWKGAETGEDAA